jgi:hypothetical protein
VIGTEGYVAAAESHSKYCTWMIIAIDDAHARFQHPGPVVYPGSSYLRYPISLTSTFAYYEIGLWRRLHDTRFQPKYHKVFSLLGKLNGSGNYASRLPDFIPILAP